MRPQKIATQMKTEERILANALQHFSDFGYSGTSVREITTASEVTKPTLYYYFKNKEELFSKLAEGCFTSVLARLEASVAEEKSFESSLKALFNAIRDYFNNDPVGLRFVHSIMVTPQKGAPTVSIENFASKLDGFLEKILDNAVKSGECLIAKKATTHVLCSALFGLYTKSIVATGTSSLDIEMINKVVKALVFCANNSACVAT